MYNTCNVDFINFQSPVTYNPSGEVQIVAVDCGMKFHQIRCLCERGAAVTVVPWNHPLTGLGIVD